MIVIMRVFCYQLRLLLLLLYYLRRDTDAASCSPDVESRFLVEENNDQTWEDARKVCQSYTNDSSRWDLAVIDNEQEFQYLQNVTKNGGSKYWIGLSDIQQEGIFRWIRHDNFIERRPSDIWSDIYPKCKATKNCVVFDDGDPTRIPKFKDWPCGDAKAFICENSRIKCSIPPPTHQVPDCVNARYHFINQTKSWQAARNYCKHNLTADLLEIETYNEYLYIQNRVWPTEIQWFVGLSRLRQMEDCQQALGMENKEIPDSSLSASSYFTYNDKQREAKYARLNYPDSDNFWATEIGDNDPWIQVNLGEEKGVTGVKIQGSHVYYVQKLRIATALGEGDLEYIYDDQHDPKVFDALDSASDLRTLFLANYTIMAQFIRLEPVNQTCLQNNGEQSIYCCIRFEVIGCNNYDTCDDALGMEDNTILDSQLSSSSVRDANHGVKYARLNHQQTSSICSCWATGVHDINQWIQVDLLEPTKVSGVILQGRHSNHFIQWVKAYKVSYTIGTIWSFVIDKHDTTEVFPGNTDSDTPVKSVFHNPVVAVRVRIHPTEWQGSMALRFELLGIRDDWHWVSNASETLNLKRWRWQYSEPATGRDQNCGLLSEDISGTIGYQVRGCSIKRRRFICEKADCGNSDTFEINNNHQLSGHVLHTVDVTSLSECTLKCSSEPYCESINMYSGNVKDISGIKLCELNSASKITHSDDFKVQNGITYAGRGLNK